MGEWTPWRPRPAPVEARRSEPLLQAWLGRPVRRTVTENDQRVLAQVPAAYGNRLKTVDKLPAAACRFVPNVLLRKALDAADVGKRYLRRMLSRS